MRHPFLFLALLVFGSFSASLAAYHAPFFDVFDKGSIQRFAMRELRPSVLDRFARLLESPEDVDLPPSYLIGDGEPCGRILNQNTWTISFWKRVYSPEDRMIMMSDKKELIVFGDGTLFRNRFNRYEFFYNNQLFISDEKRLESQIGLTQDPDFGGWQHVALVRDGEELRLYLGGERMGTTSINQTMMNEPAIRNDPFCAKLGSPDLNVTFRNFYVLDGLASPEDIRALAVYLAPSGARLYDHPIRKRGVELPSNYLGQFEFDSTFLFSKVPPVGEFPRLLFRQSDLPQILRQLSQSKKGRFAVGVLNASLEVELASADTWYQNFKVGKLQPIPKPQGFQQLAAYAFGAFLMSEAKPAVAAEVATATYSAIKSLINLEPSKPPSDLFHRSYAILQQGYDVLVAFDLMARFMDTNQVKECMDFFVRLSNVTDRDPKRGKWSSDAQEQFELDSDRFLNYRASNQEIWKNSVLSMLDILIHGWPGSIEDNTHHWVFYWQLAIRKVHTRNGIGIEPTGKEANDLIVPVALALKRLIPESPNLLQQPQLYRETIGKVHQLFPHSPNINDLGTWSRALIQDSVYSTLFPGNPFFAFASRVKEVELASFLPETLLTFGIRKPGTYGFLPSGDANSDLSLAFTTSPMKPRYTKIGENGSFWIGAGIGAESIKPVLKSQDRFNVSIIFQDVGNAIRKPQVDIFSLVFEDSTVYFSFSARKEKDGRELWCLVIGGQPKTCFPRRKFTWEHVQVKVDQEAAVLSIDGAVIGDVVSLPGVNPSKELWFVAGYRNHRENPEELARMLDCWIQSVDIQSFSSPQRIHWSGLREQHVGLQFRGYVPVMDLYKSRDSMSDLRALNGTECPMDKAVLAEAIPNLPLDFSDDDIGQFIARASFSAASSSAVLHTSIMGHNKKSSGHVDIIGVGLPWITPSRRLAPNSEEYMVVAVDGKYPPGGSGSMVGSYIGAQRSAMASGAAVDLTFAYRFADRMFNEKDEWIADIDEVPLTSESINVSFAFRTVVFLRVQEDRGVTLILDDIDLRGAENHTYTLSAGFDREDEIIRSGPLWGDQGAFEYTIRSNRTRWTNTEPGSGNGVARQYYEDYSGSRRCYVKVLQGSDSRPPVTMETKKLFGSSAYYQGYDNDISYQSDGTLDHHFGNQVRLSVSSPSAQFLTAYYPHLEGEAIPKIQWSGPHLHVYAPDQTGEEPMFEIIFESSPYSPRRIIHVKNHWSLHP